jgi:hypothetical protein
MKNVGHDGDEERFPLTHVRNDHDGDKFPINVILRPFDCACMVFWCAFLRSYEEPGWRDIDWHLPHGGQTP